MYKNDFLRTVMKYFGQEPTMTEKLKYSIGVTWSNMGKYFKSMFSKEESFWDSPIFKETIKKLGWNEDKKLKKDDIKNLLSQILGEDVIKSTENSTIFNEIYDLFLSSFPEEIKLGELKDYLDHNKFIQVAKSYFVKEPTNYEKLRDYFANSWNNVGRFFKRIFVKEESFWDSLTYKNLISKLGWEKKTEITREDLRHFFKQLFGEDIMKKYGDLLHEIYDKYLADLPDKIQIADLKKYLDYNKFYKLFREYFSQKYPEIKDKFKDLQEFSWSNIQDIFSNIFDTIGKATTSATSKISQFWNENLYNTIFSDMGFNKKEEISKEELRTFINRLFFDNRAKVKLPKVIQEVFDAYFKRIPNKIKIKDIHTYLDWNKFIEAVREVASRNYGSSHLLKYKSVFESPKRNFTDILYQVFNYTVKHEDL